MSANFQHWAFQGDCIQWLGLLPDNSVDAVVSDPPYGLGDPPDPREVMAAWMAGEEYLATGGGFMGRVWDAFIPGPEVWRECYRVLKPGGHLVAFSSTRTVDWLGLALRFSGFEVRDTVSWLYWCLDEETEILTDQGWARYSDPTVGRRALCFDVEDGSFRWGEISAQPVFDFEGLAYRLHGGGTDQLVTGGHRCVTERDGAFGFEFARDLARERSACVPVVEDLRALLEPGPQALRGTRHTRSAVVRVDPVAHRGKMWCVTVPTGAFVARRRGMVFVTGNSGFPKGTLDAGKLIDKRAGAEREVVGQGHRVVRNDGATPIAPNSDGAYDITLPATEEAKLWTGWSSSLKPCQEPAVLARKPISEDSTVENLLRWGTGYLNVDACRFAEGAPEWPGTNGNLKGVQFDGGATGVGSGAGAEIYGYRERSDFLPHELGRFPGNVLVVPKPARKEKDRGTAGLPWVLEAGEGTKGAGPAQWNQGWADEEKKKPPRKVRNNHPTVKPVRLMRWLVRLLTPPGGLVIDPFLGSGTTGIAATLEEMRFGGSELSEAFHRIAESRMQHARVHPAAWLDTRPGNPKPW